MLETKSHRHVFDALMLYGGLYFAREKPLPKLHLRLEPLLVGPTGAGKSFVVERVAKKLFASYFRLTRGDWIASGCTAGRSTCFQILDWLLTCNRGVLHLDELDKLTNLHGGGEWSASIGTDLWSILDRKFQVERYLGETKFEGGHVPTIDELRTKIRNRLWIVGSGTFQGLFERSRAGARIGFSAAADCLPVRADSIAAERLISPELLCRFSGDILFLDYPTPKETEDLLDFSGVNALASKLGISVGASDIDWTKGGMRALETLGTRLALQHFAQQSASEISKRSFALKQG